MALPLYLAMTAAEFQSTSPLPPAIAWMACHFSPYGVGLSNLPQTLPENSMIIVNDRTPIGDHDPDYIRSQLLHCIEECHACALLMDLQRQGNAQTARLVLELTRDFPVPVCVSESYAAGIDCPIFLPPVPPDVLCRDHLAPYSGREVWLEAAFSPLTITVTADGAAVTDSSLMDELPFYDAPLHCSYGIDTDSQKVTFHMQRSWENLLALLDEAQEWGVTKAVGLFQELHTL